MEDYLPDDYYFDEGDDPLPLVFQESFWSSYLEKNDRKVADFLTAFMKYRGLPDQMARASYDMGWENPPKDFWAECNPGEPDYQRSYHDTKENSFFCVAVYTPHKHPVYIVSKALAFYVLRYWEWLIEKRLITVPLVQATSFVKQICQAETHALQAINTLEFSDLNLTVCHLKRSLDLLNGTLKILNDWSQLENKSLQEYAQVATNTLFELREVWLFLMDACRKLAEEE